jgi:hypothetical protein
MEDTEQAIKWLGFALNDLQRGNDLNLVRKAEHHRGSVEFRQKLNSYYPVSETSSNFDRDRVETEGSSILSTLIHDRLFLEARKVCDVLLPLLGDYSKERLSRELERILVVED